MSRHVANVLNPSSIKSVYPYEVWAAEAAMNSSGRMSVLRGLAVLSRPAADGAFELAGRTRAAGDRSADRDSVFLCPYMGKAYDAFASAPGVHGAVAAKANATADLRPEYEAFIAEVIEKARHARLTTACG